MAESKSKEGNRRMSELLLRNHTSAQNEPFINGIVSSYNAFNLSVSTNEKK